MKVKCIEIYRLKPAMVERPFPVVPVVCRIVSENGTCGYGEAGIASGCGAYAVANMLKELAGNLVGIDIMRSSAFWHQQNTSAYGHVSGGGAIFYSALAAIDIALTDLYAKLLGVPAYELLGGKVRDEVDCYASQVHDGWKSMDYRFDTAGKFAEGAALVRSEGFHAAKFNFHAVDRNGRFIPLTVSANPAYASEIAELARERLSAIRKVVGTDFVLIGESLNRLCPATAAVVDEVAHEFNIAYMEEYFFPYDVTVYVDMAKSFKTPIACGEKLFTRQNFLPYFCTRSISIAQPDVSMCGLTEAKKICDMAEAFQIGVQPHLCGTAICTAASLQLEATLNNFVLHEFLVSGYNTEVQAYCTDIFVPENGKLKIPDSPGIGVELSEQAMAEAVEKIIITA